MISSKYLLSSIDLDAVVRMCRCAEVRTDRSGPCSDCLGTVAVSFFFLDMLDLLGFAEVGLVFYDASIGLVLNLGSPLGPNGVLSSWQFRCSEHATEFR